jgi:serine-type D-Ala-D-Ala carboxypeptidase/endopeptidase (penicillin-binding protein 4)
LHSRKPVYALLAAGALVVAVLTFFPYTLAVVERAGRRVVQTVQQSLPGGGGAAAQPQLEEVQPPPPPQFDAALWYGSREDDAPERHGVLIQSFDGRQVFASHNADTTFNPASLVKLATTLVALRRLGPDHRFETRVYADGPVNQKTKTLEGSLHVAGNDPSFGDFAAHLLAKELRARGIEKVRDRVTVAPSFSFNFNEKPEDSAKHTADVLKLGQKETGVADGAAGAELFVLRSNPLREILLYMNAHSINFVADRIGGQLGGPAEIARHLVTELRLPAEQVYLETCSGLYTNRMTPRGIVAVIRALAAEANRLGLRLEDLMPVAGCDWGTLRRRLEETPFRCAAVGKTGTLTETDGGMSNLAGVAFTQDAGPVLFVVLSQGTRIWESKESTDALLAEVLARHPAAPLAAPDAPRRHLLPSANLAVEPQLASRDAPRADDDERREAEQEKEDDDEEDVKSRRPAKKSAREERAAASDSKRGATKKSARQTAREPARKPARKPAQKSSKRSARRR